MGSKLSGSRVRCSRFIAERYFLNTQLDKVRSRSRSSFESENSTIEALSLTTQTGQKIQIGLEGAVVSIPYQVRDETMGDGGGNGTASETITYAISVQNSGSGNKFYVDGVQQQKLVLIEATHTSSKRHKSSPGGLARLKMARMVAAQSIPRSFIQLFRQVTINVTWIRLIYSIIAQVIRGWVARQLRMCRMI